MAAAAAAARRLLSSRLQTTTTRLLHASTHALSLSLSPPSVISPDRISLHGLPFASDDAFSFSRLACSCRCFPGSSTGDFGGFIHPAAVVHPDAVIGQGVLIGPFCTVGPSARIGDACQLHGGSHVMGDTELGEGCVVQT
ncbi:hypothetical protein U9M48_017890 [Paspalum notatum var. saurae]